MCISASQGIPKTIFSAMEDSFMRRQMRARMSDTLAKFGLRIASFLPQIPASASQHFYFHISFSWYFIPL